MPLELSIEYVEMLKREGTKASQICLSLNSNKVFESEIKSSVNNDYKNIKYSAEHILLHDIVNIFKSFTVLYGGVQNAPSKAKFILIFFYEKLQGRDLSEKYGINQLNNILNSSRFQENTKTILETSFYQPKTTFNQAYLIPAILLKTNNEHFSSVTAFLNRIASLIAKADNSITSAEERLLKQIFEKSNKPQIIIENAKHNSIPEDDTLEKVLLELNELIGLKEVKKNIDDLTNFLKVQKLRENNELKSINTSLHTVFMGPPGTGKTTVARLLGRVFKHLGYLKSGHLVETDRSGLVAGYVGQTAIKVDEIINTAKGGVLFIDEAYSLSSGGLNDFGNEAIEILLKRMEDYRGEIVVIVAGYPTEMEGFIKSNPGLQSRFNRYFTFNHFPVESLMEIFKLIAKKADFELTEDAEEKLNEIIVRIHENKHKGFGNARTMRNLFEKVIERQANRVIKTTPITTTLLKTLIEEDIPEILKTVKEITQFDEDNISS